MDKNICTLDAIVYVPVPMAWTIRLNPSQWRHNDHDGYSNHQSHDYLLNRFCRRRSKKTSKLRVTGLFWGIHRSPVNFPNNGPVSRKKLPFDDVIIPCICLPWEKNAIAWATPDERHYRCKNTFVCLTKQIKREKIKHCTAKCATRRFLIYGIWMIKRECFSGITCKSIQQQSISY